MHILTNKGLRKAEQVEVQHILANLYNDLDEASRRVSEDPTGYMFDFNLGYLTGIALAQKVIFETLDVYDDPDFIHDSIDGQGEA